MHYNLQNILKATNEYREHFCWLRLLWWLSLSKPQTQDFSPQRAFRQAQRPQGTVLLLEPVAVVEPVETTSFIGFFL